MNTHCRSSTRELGSSAVTESTSSLMVVVAVEVKSVESLAPIHDAQMLTYLRLGGWRVGLLINFNVEVLKNGIHRKIMGYEN